MSILQHIKEAIGQRLSDLNRGQGGAVAIMVLAALLIAFMISLVIYDTGKIARDKLEVQAAAETAAWSHTAVEARSMNTIAFANIGKKLIVGMNSYYDALVKSYVILAAIVLAVIIICAIASIIGVGAACLDPAIEMGVALAKIFANEAEDIGKFYGGDMKSFFKDDLKALDNYQVYMASITPWWAWMEGYLRGARNGAMGIGTFPAPENKASSIIGAIPSLGGLLPTASNVFDKLPARRAPGANDAKKQLCDRLWSEGDVIINALDYVIKSIIENTGTYEVIIIAITALLAMTLTKSSCNGFMSGRFGEPSWPFEIPKPGNAAAWQLATSNLVFAFRPNASIKTDKNKYNFLKFDYDKSAATSANFSWDATGSWALARAEIAFQDDFAPDLWHTNWSSRMRPVALGDEWTQAGVKPSSAAMDALVFIAIGNTLSGAASGKFSQNFDNILANSARLLMSMKALDSGRSAGLSR
jgi:hypothetical protein